MFDRRRAVENAMHLFWHNGYARTTTRDLEDVLGITTSSFYNAFGSKEELLDEALGRYLARLDQDVLDPIRRDAEGLDSITRFLSAVETWVTDDGCEGCLVARLIGEGGEYSSQVSQHLSRYRDEICAALRAGLERAAAAGEIPADSVDRRLDLLHGAVLGLNLAALGPAGAAGVHRLAAANRDEVASWRA